MKPLVVIPARGGSKRLPGKNIKPLNCKPLIHYTIEAAREVFEDKLICVSTDDPEIKKTAELTGLKVPFLRPATLATDSASSRDTLLHAYYYYKNNGYEADTIILLQPTSPFRNSKHIEEAIQFYNSNLDMVVSVKKTSASPYSLLYEENSAGYLKKSKNPEELDNPKEIPTVWELNGAIYVINRQSVMDKSLAEFDKIKKYEMPEIVSIDIDTKIDWHVAELISKHYLN